MRVVMLAAGAGGMYCGSCIRDNRLASALRAQGRDVLLVPLYTPLRLDEPDASTGPVLFGGINVYLRQRYRFMRYVPRALTRVLDSAAMLRTAGRFAAKVRPDEVADLTIGVLEGRNGRHADEITALADTLNVLRPNAVVLPNLLLAGFAGPLRERLGAPICCTLGGEDVFVDQLPEPQRTKTFDLIRSAAAPIDAFFAVTRYYGEHATRHFGLPPDRTHHTPMGIDLSHFRASAESRNGRPFTIGYLARICPEKGLSLLCDAFIRLRRAGRECRLAIAGSVGPGEDEYFAKCLRKLRDAGMAGDVEVAESPSHDEKVAFLARIHVLSVPTVYPEAKGLYVLEALAAGVPVVQPAHGSFPELVGETGGGLLFNPHDHKDLADNLARLMDLPELRATLAANGREAAHARFSDRHMAEATWQVLERLRA